MQNFKPSGSAQSNHHHVGQMRRGDYMIHVYVEKGKEFRLSSEDTVDPMIEISCLGGKKYTTAKDDIGQIAEVSWFEHVFLESRNVEKRDSEEAKILIKLLDKGFFKNSLIG